MLNVQTCLVLSNVNARKVLLVMDSFAQVLIISYKLNTSGQEASDSKNCALRLELFKFGVSRLGAL